jgi:rhodanese-related sulfurtransferase
MPDVQAVTEIDPGEARRMAAGGALFLDVREDDEWQSGHAPEATHLAMGLVGGRLDELPADRTIVCICRVGRRSGAVAAELALAGFDVRNLAGGMVAWEQAGLPVVAESGGTGRVL